MKTKCLNCGKPAKKHQCNSCSNYLSLCANCLDDYFPINTESEFVCIDCASNGGGETRWEKGIEAAKVASKKQKKKMINRSETARADVRAEKEYTLLWECEGCIQGEIQEDYIPEINYEEEIRYCPLCGTIMRHRKIEI